MNTGCGPSLDEAVLFIARQPGGPHRLLSEHRPDDRGRCRGCTAPGTGIPHASWPCAMAVLANAARKLCAALDADSAGPHPRARQVIL